MRVAGVRLTSAANLEDEEAAAMNTIELKGIVHSDPDILGGTPVFVGTRVPVESLFDHLKAGDSIEVFLDGFPSVRREQVLAVLELMEQEILAQP